LRPSVRFWILAGLLAANLVAGVLSLYFVRSINQRYAELFEHGAPAIYDLRRLTREVTGVQRFARRLISPEYEKAWDSLMPEMEAAGGQLAQRSRDVGAMVIFQDTAHPAAIDGVSREYGGHVQRFLQLVRENRLGEAMHFNLTELRPCHDRFQETLDAAANHVEAEGRNLRDRYRRDSRFFGGLSLAFASAPLVAMSLGLLVMTAMIGLLCLVFLSPRSDRRA
jgi:hypothetical protein